MGQVLHRAEAGSSGLSARPRHRTVRRRMVEAALRKERDFLRRFLAAGEDQRQEAAGRLHDGLIQPLVAVVMNLEMVQKAAGGLLQESDRTALGQSLEMLRCGLAQSRKLMYSLRPLILDELGIAAAVEHLVYESWNEGGADIECSHAVSEELWTRDQKSSAFRIVEEGLDNALRHSGSRKVRIDLAQARGRAHIKIEDWGIGFDVPRRIASGLGLRTIRARARLLRGHARILSAPGRGTRIVVELPIG